MSKLLIGAFDFSAIFKTVKTRWYYYVIALAFIILLFCFLFLKKQNKRNNLSKTQKLCYVGILTALAVISNVFDIKVSDVFQISFCSAVGFISGYLLGGGLGFSVLFIGDLLGAIIFPKGPYNPIIGIGTGLWGLIPGIAYSYFKGKKEIKLIISFLVGFLTISCLINVVGFCLMYPTMYTFEILLPTLPFKFIVVVINAVLCFGLIYLLPKILPKDKFDL